MAASLQYRLTTGGLGGASTATQLSGTAMNNLFDNITPDEATGGDNEYRVLDIYNAGDATATAVAFYCNGTTSTGTDLLAAIEASPIGSTTSITDEATAPAVSGTFTAYTSASKLTLPDIAASAYVRVWFKRTVQAGTTNLAVDQSTLSVEYA